MRNTIRILACLSLITVILPALPATASIGQKLDEYDFQPTFSDDFSGAQQYYTGGPIWNAPPQPFRLNDPSFKWHLGYYNCEQRAPGRPSSAPPEQFAPAYSSLTHEAEIYPNYDEVLTSGLWPFTLKPNNLDIIAQPLPEAIKPNVPAKLPGRYLSGAFTTYPRAQQYGYFEMKAKLPAGRGLWPAFWLLPLSGSGEIDIMEMLGHDPSTLYASVHSNTLPGSMKVSVVKTADLSQDFHTFGADWGPKDIVFYIDRIEVARTPTPSDMHRPYYLLFNLAVGGPGSWPGPPDATTKFPAHFEIAYVKIWQRAQYVGAP